MIASFPLAFTTCCCLILLSGGALAWFQSELDLVDRDAGRDIGEIARELCETTKGFEKQIGRISTVVKLDDYFHAQPDNRLFECDKLYHDSLHALRELLEISPNNVCSPSKISAIESFHRDFVSTAREDVAAREGHYEAPQMLRLFFMHYAMEVSAICKRSLLNNLEVEVRDKFGEADYKLTGDRLLSEYANTLMGPDDKVNSFEDVLLIGDLFSSTINGEITDEIVDPILGEPAKLFIKARDTSAVNELKRKCSHRFRPIYESLIVPIIRLANLGYSNTGDQFQRELEELRNNELAKKWYTITQVCEAIRPILYLQDASLASQETVVVSKEEALLCLSENKQVSEQSESPLQYEPTTNSLEGVDLLDSVSSTEVQQMVRRVDSKTSARDRSIKRIMVKLTKKIKTLPKKIFFSHKEKADTCPRSGCYEKEDLVKTFSSMSDEELLNLEGAGSMRRRAIQRNKYRSRMDDNTLLDMVASRDQEMHTKSWGQIFYEWKEAIMPNKITWFIFVLISLAVVVLIITLHCVG